LPRSNSLSRPCSPSLAAQRASIARQVGDRSSESFFLLGPPSQSGLVPVLAPESDCEPLPASQLDSLIEGAAKQQDLQPELLRSMVNQESGARPCAVSPKGAMGLMQLMPATAAQLGVKDPFDPQENLNAGAWFVKQLLTIYNDLPLALGAYNAGPARVNAIDGIPAIPETQNTFGRSCPRCRQEVTREPLESTLRLPMRPPWKDSYGMRSGSWRPL
jgi:soluble lytic murein transglycosylase-like protein